MKFAIGAILAIGLAAGAAQASDKKGNFHILGAGTVSCDYYLKAKPEERQHGETWWAGYATAINRTTDDTYNVLGKTSAEQVNDLINKACTANRKALLTNVVHDVLEGLYKTRTKVSP